MGSAIPIQGFPGRPGAGGGVRVAQRTLGATQGSGRWAKTPPGGAGGGAWDQKPPEVMAP